MDLRNRYMLQTAPADTYAINIFRYLNLIIIPIAALATGCTNLPDRSVAAIEQASYISVHTHAPNALPQKSAILDKAYAVEQALNNGHTNHWAAVLETGDEALLTRIHLARSAHRSICIQSFIWKDDEVTRFLFDELVQAAQRGIKVRILIDALNYMATPQQLARMATASPNLEFCLYRPISDMAVNDSLNMFGSAMFRMRRLNRRMHNKTFIVDGIIGIAGGRNYEDTYYDRNPSFIFKDRDVLVVSPEVRNMSKSFNKFWNNDKTVHLSQFKDVRRCIQKGVSPWKHTMSKDKLFGFTTLSRKAKNYDIAQTFSDIKLRKVRRLQFIADSPAKFYWNPQHEMNETVLKAMPHGQNYIFFQTPYLIYESTYRSELKQIRRKNPNFRVIFSSNSLAAADHITTYALSFKYRKKMYKKLGLDIYEFRPYPKDIRNLVPHYHNLTNIPDEKMDDYILHSDIIPMRKNAPRLCIHAKTVVVDGECVLIGSHNFDPRSDNLNTECGFIIYDAEFTALVEKVMRRMIEPGNSWVVGKRRQRESLLSRISGTIGSIFSAIPFFDIWPDRYTTVYELRPGKDPLDSPRDPKFHEHYRDVGQFPEVNNISTDLRARLIKAFGGWTNNLM